MTEKRFTTDYKDFLKEDMTFIKNNDKRMTFQEIVDLLNELYEENQELKSKVKRYMEIELLKAKDFANCHNCRNNRSVHDGVALDGMCAINGLINVDGYFDTEYHKLPTGTICPCWELEE